MKANSTKCSQASVPLIERTFLYKVKRKDQKAAVCLERETRHLLRLSLFSLIDSKGSKEQCSCF